MVGYCQGGSFTLGGHQLVSWWGIVVTVGGGALSGWHHWGGSCALGERQHPPMCAMHWH